MEVQKILFYKTQNVDLDLSKGKCKISIKNLVKSSLLSGEWIAYYFMNFAQSLVFILLILWKEQQETSMLLYL